jgi:hypothetical protein
MAVSQCNVLKKMCNAGFIDLGPPIETGAEGRSNIVAFDFLETAEKLVPLATFPHFEPPPSTSSSQSIVQPQVVAISLV